MHVYIMSVVAENVLSRRDLTLEGATLEVSPAQDVWDGKTIEVCGLKPSTTHDSILMFFESKRRSDGGEVVNVQRDTNNNITYIIFEKTQG